MKQLLLVLVLIGAGICNAGAASLQVMVGQMIMVGFRGDHARSGGVKAVADAVKAGRIGGVIYLRNNISSLSETRSMNRLFQQASGDWPVLIALDQEGGSIERLTRAVGFEEIPSAHQIARNQSVAQAGQIYGKMARGLATLGFNFNLGPVVDLNINPDNPIIARYERSFGDDAQTVSDYAGSFVLAHHQAGVLTTLKHFPGHGSSHSDSHKGFVDITPYWQARELDPYRILIRQGLVDVVMMAHLYHEQYAGEGKVRLPASLSPYWIEGVLRGQLGYQGVVISDDLEMGAIRAQFSLKEAVVRAVEAGSDILLFSNTADYRTSLGAEVGQILMDRANADPAFRQRVEQSFQRIAVLKNKLGAL